MALQFCLWLGNKGDTSNARDWERPEACLWQQGQEEAGAVGRGGGGPESDTVDCCGSAPGKQTIAGRCLRSVVLCALGSTQLAAAFCIHVVFLQG